MMAVSKEVAQARCEGNVAGVVVGVAAVVALNILPLLIALITGLLGSVLRLQPQQFVEDFLYATSLARQVRS